MTAKEHEPSLSFSLPTWRPGLHIGPFICSLSTPVGMNRELPRIPRQYIYLSLAICDESVNWNYWHIVDAFRKDVRMGNDSEYIEDGRLCSATINIPGIPDGSVQVQAGIIHYHAPRGRVDWNNQNRVKTTEIASWGWKRKFTAAQAAYKWRHNLKHGVLFVHL